MQRGSNRIDGDAWHVAGPMIGYSQALQVIALPAKLMEVAFGFNEAYMAVAFALHSIAWPLAMLD